MKPPSSRRLFCLAAVTAVAACATLAARRGRLADQEVVRLPHHKHKVADIDCPACHAKVTAATTLEGRLLPGEKTCLRCHSDWKESGRCDACHVTPKPETWPRRERRVNLSHAGHLPLVDDNCGKCHPAPPEPGKPESGTPPMGSCLACHNHQKEYDEARCVPCHVDLLHLPLRPVAYFSHQADYLHQHRLPARTSAQACAQCHDPLFCADCHAKTVATPVELKFPERADREVIHRGDYVSRHAIEAAADPALCLRCHSQLYCNGCHRESGIHPDSKSPRDPHPYPGWSTPGSARFHGTAARRDIVSCAACHDQGAAANCVGCHRVGGIGGNPHPPSFIRSRGPADIGNNRMCLACHP